MASSLDASIEWVGVRDQWRARIGRLPRGHEGRLRLLVTQYGGPRVLRSITRTAQENMRRTTERWAFFLALFGEAP